MLKFTDSEKLSKKVGLEKDEGSPWEEEMKQISLVDCRQVGLGTKRDLVRERNKILRETTGIGVTFQGKVETSAVESTRVTLAKCPHNEGHRA